MFWLVINLQGSKMNPEKGNRALRKGRVSLVGHYYVLTFVTENRQSLFFDFNLACQMASILNNKKILKSTKILSWVIMPDHVHLLIQLGKEHTLGSLVGSIKSMSTRSLKQPSRIWGKDFYDHMVRDENNLQNAARYIVANPLRAGLVKKVADYPFWNAVWL